MLRNQDLFANKDSELGHTDTVKMHIDVGVNRPIKMRPYGTPIKNREVIDKAIDIMLDADANSYPLPLIGDILALLGKSKFFTSLDLKCGYWQVAMDVKDKVVVKVCLSSMSCTLTFQMQSFRSSCL